MKTVYYVACTLDGYIADADGGVGFLNELGTPDEPDESPDMAPYETFYADIDGLIMGRRTYDQVLGFGAWPYAAKPTWILSHRPIPTRDDDEPIAAIGGTPAEVHDQIANTGIQHLWVVGGGSLAGQWLGAGLLDEIIISYVPIVLGRGVPLFGEQAVRASMRLTSATERPRGIVEIRYNT